MSREALLAQHRLTGSLVIRKRSAEARPPALGRASSAAATRSSSSLLFDATDAVREPRVALRIEDPVQLARAVGAISDVRAERVVTNGSENSDHGHNRALATSSAACGFCCTSLVRDRATDLVAPWNRRGWSSCLERRPRSTRLIANLPPPARCDRRSTLRSLSCELRSPMVRTAALSVLCARNATALRPSARRHSPELRCRTPEMPFGARQGS
jgi:hypothetical protein